MPITLSLNDVLTIALIIAVVMLIILLFHAIGVALYFKKFAERMDFLSKEVEAIILKPLSAIDYMIEWFGGFVEGLREKHEAEAEEEDKPKKAKTHKVKARPEDQDVVEEV